MLTTRIELEREVVGQIHGQYPRFLVLSQLG
jgi:hypothetical protein